MMSRATLHICDVITSICIYIEDFNLTLSVCWEKIWHIEKKFPARTLGISDWPLYITHSQLVHVSVWLLTDQLNMLLLFLTLKTSQSKEPQPHESTFPEKYLTLFKGEEIRSAAKVVTFVARCFLEKKKSCVSCVTAAPASYVGSVAMS